MDRRQFLRSSLGAAVAATLPGTPALAKSLLHIPTSITSDIDAVTFNGDEITLPKAMVQELSDSLKGKILLPNMAGYDDARSLLQQGVDKHPAFVVQPTGAADVQHAVRFAQEHSLRLAVKCGGHAVSGSSSCDHGMQIDLSQLRNARVDRAAKTARIAGGSLLGELDYEAMAHGLVTTAGTVSHTGVGGLTLGGGFGRLQRKFGLTIDSVLEMDVVTPDGKLRRVSADNEPDLYWALRGGGGNFGVVTSFLFQLHEMQRDVVSALFIFPIAEAKQVMNFVAEHGEDLPDEMAIGAGAGARLGEDPVAVIFSLWCGDPAQADKHFAPLRKAGTVVFEDVRKSDYVAVQRSGDIEDVRNFTGHVKSGFLGELTPKVVDDLVDNFESQPDRGTRFICGRLGGAIGRVGRNDTAFSQRDAKFDCLSFIDWKPGADKTEHMEYMDAHWSNVERHTTGFYVNDYYDQTQEQVNATYRDNFPRLLALKQQYDPTNLFRLNANIREV